MPQHSAFTKKQLEEFRATLEKIRHDVIQDIQQRLAAKRDDIGVKEIGDAFDTASEGREAELGYLMNTRDREKIMKVEEALRRLKDGDYGICEECGEAIGVKRLRALPFALLCVRCQEEEEQAEQLQRERELEEDERQYFELAETELNEEEDTEE